MPGVRARRRADDVCGGRLQQQILRNVKTRIDDYVKSTELRGIMPQAIMSTLVNNKAPSPRPPDSL